MEQLITIVNSQAGAIVIILSSLVAAGYFLIQYGRFEQPIILSRALPFLITAGVYITILTLEKSGGDIISIRFITRIERLTYAIVFGLLPFSFDWIRSRNVS